MFEPGRDLLPTLLKVAFSTNSLTDVSFQTIYVLFAFDVSSEYYLPSNELH